MALANVWSSGILVGPNFIAVVDSASLSVEWNLNFYSYTASNGWNFDGSFDLRELQTIIQDEGFTNVDLDQVKIDAKTGKIYVTLYDDDNSHLAVLTLSSGDGLFVNIEKVFMSVNDYAYPLAIYNDHVTFFNYVTGVLSMVRYGYDLNADDYTMITLKKTLLRDPSESQAMIAIPDQSVNPA